MNRFGFLAIPILLLLNAHVYEAQLLSPPINIAAGKPIAATATCGVGVSEPELYCKLASVPGKFGIKGLECDRCIPDSYSRDHAIKYAVDGSERWWQSPPLSRGLNYQRVNITIDLQREYQVAYVVIKTGNAPRPGVWSLERSIDNGRTFTPWQHFATSPSECRRHFGIETLIALTRDDSVKCSTEYSSIPPFENGEIHISLVTGRPGAANFSYSPTLQEWTRATHIRLRLMKVRTLLTDLLPLAREDPTVTRRYFYSIKDISVGAICMCNGHADQCVESRKGSALEFVCNCKHNTCGSRCEKCCPSFVQKEWRPGTPTGINECEACNCHQHSSECYYDPLVAQSRRSLDLNNRYEGGGVCVNCQHNTAGINCERCKQGYFNPTGIPKTSRDACRPCNCDPKYSTGRCYDGSGNCECKPKYGGARCDRCSEGFYGFPDCRPCDCNPAGTTGRVCGPTGNQCPCKPNFAGNKCDRCAPGYYGYPQCQRCNCDNFGSFDTNCDATTGQCRCRQTYRGRQCNQCSRGFYSFPECKPCNCDSEGTAPGICDPVFGRCICLKNFAGARCDQCNEGYYRFPECIDCGCSKDGSVSPRCDTRGVCTCKDNYIGAKCENCKLGYYGYPRCIKCACDPRGAVHEFCNLNTGQCTCRDDNRGLNCNQCRAGYYGFPNCKRCQCNPAGIKPIPGRPFGDCSYSNDGQCDCKDNVQGLICSECKPGFHNLQSGNPRGCDACYCDLAGVIAGLANCDDRTGQCTCKQHVTGTRCNTCKVGYFGLEAKREFGCAGCNCDVGGSYDQVCDAKTGQCKCRPHVEGLDCSRPVKDFFYPDLLHVKAEVEDGCVPAPPNGVQGRDVPGLFQSDPARQGDDSGNCNPVRYGFDEAVYPGFSWKGYVGFNALQKEIKVTLEVPKTGRYHIIFNYALNDSSPVIGEISLSPRGQGSKQSSPVTFTSTRVGSTYVSGFATAGAPGQPSQFMLTQGTWELTFKAPPSKLLVDYISAIPREYYQAYILQRKVTNPCIVNSQDPLCVQYSYLNTIGPNFPTVELETGYIITRQGRQQTHVFDDKKVLEQLDFNAMAYLDRTQTRVTEDVNLPKVGDYVLVMQYYHPSDQTKTLDVYLRSRRSQQKGTFYLHSCRFKFGCRQVALDKDRRLKIFKANEIERRVITLLIDSDTSVAVDSITAIPLEQWNLDYVVPKPLCTTKNNKCISTSYPIPKGAVQYDVAADGSKAPPNILNPKTTLKYLEGEVSYGVVFDNLRTGQYAIVVHYYQPKHVSFSTSRATVTSDRAIGGRVQFDYCPNVEGCRAVVKNLADNANPTSFNIGRSSGELQMTIPRGSSAWIDYVLFIPRDRFSQDASDPNPVSFAKDFVVDCAKDSFFIKPTASSVCTKPVFSLTTAFNNGTLPCECDAKGAVDSECNKFGGQCRCKQNVIGRKCNRCKTGYYGFPNCYKCQCVFCNEVTGACDCPTNTVGRNCELCLKGTYGYDPILGCQDCKCDVSGVIGGDVACDPVTGKCPCKPSHTGRRCNQCAPGRYGYPYCDKCDCDKRGVVSDICDAKGTCLCKAGVVGRRCNTCVAGYFNLDGNNPNGCTSCWCSGLSKICSSSTLKRFNIRQMDGWRIENTPAQPIKSALTTVMASVAGKRTNPDKPIYWLAPDKYTGKQIYSYGGSLTFLLRYTVPVEVTTPVLTVYPDVIIHGKNGVEMTYKNQMTLQPNTVHKIQVHFNESLWSVANNSRSSRADFMDILVDIESMKIRASYSTAVADTAISDVLMDSALESNIGAVAKEVEKCVCPSKASGTSCELCGKGYTRGADNRTCVKCQCHGHSDDCHPETGECYNCLHDTTGDRCQTCIKGYYGNGTKGTPNDCQLCKCPLGISSNSFASECALDKNGRLTCVCNKGYTGQQCDQCADGYYGDPTVAGDYCKTCQCNGNIDPQVPDSCDPFTGVCTKCINKAAGDNCERCRDGYYGDAVVAKNCQKCQCSACGAETSLCNYTSGACLCKKNVMGERCDTCKANTWNFDSCLGCEDCNCANASLGASCDLKTGQCICKPGAIGRRCERCQAGFWNYKPEGCQVCNCPKDAENLWGFCDVNTGQCCKRDGNCTICPPNYILTPSGCEFCGECVGRLLVVAQGLDKNITTVLEYLKRGAAGVIAESKYKDLNDTLNKLIPPTNKYSHTMESMSLTVGITLVNGTANPRPLARYPLTKRIGRKDISHRGLPDAQLSNTDWVDGPNGPESAVQLRGNKNSFIHLENNGRLHSKRSTSILLWVKHEGIEGPILHFGFNKLRIWLFEDTIEACFTTDKSPNCRTSNIISANKWIHVAMIYDHETGKSELWVDNEMVDQTQISKSTLATDTDNVRMGAYPRLDDHFRGAVSCLQIFDQKLDAQQISVLKKACHPDFVHPVYGPGKSLVDRTSESETKTNTMKDQAAMVHKDAKASSKDATKTKTDALVLEQDIRDALNKSRSIINLSGSIVNKLQTGSANQTMLLEEAERILKELQNRDFTSLNNTVNLELSFIESVSDNAKMLLNETLGLHNEAQRARELIAKLKGEFNGLLDKIIGILKNVSMAEEWNEKSKKFDSMTPIMKAQARKKKMESSLKMVQQMLGKVSVSLMNATRSFEHFNGSFGRLDDLIRQVYDRFKNLTMATDMLHPLAAKASNHSEVLRKQAKILEDLLTDTQQFAEKAINASKAYANIASKLNEALVIARQAEGNATEAQEKSKAVNTRAKATNAESQKIANASSSVQDRVDNHLQKLLDDLKDRIAQLKRKIMSVEDDLGMINGTFADIDKHGDMGAKAKSAQQNATYSEMMADDAYRIAKDIESQLPGLKELQNSIIAANKNITEAENQIKDAVNKSMHIKERVQIVRTNQTRILNDLKENVLDVIQEIQDMLSDSRELLNRMSVVMEFENETETVSNPLAPPVSRDFSTIKDIELFIKPRITDALLLYLGPTLNTKKRKRRQADQMCQNDFVSLELKESRVRAVTCISGKLFTLESTEEIQAIPYETTTIVKPPPDELAKPLVDPWYKIHFNMSGVTAMLSFEYYESNKKPIKRIAPRIQKIDVSNPVLRMEKDNNFLLAGGIPSGVEVPPEINRDFYVGSMDGLRIDFLPVGLWNAEKLISPGIFYDRLAFQPKQDLNTYRFSGRGYLKVGEYSTTQVGRISFTFRTTESSGLLLLAVRDKNPEIFLMMDVVNSTFRLMYNQGRGIRTLMATTPCSDGKNHEVSLLEDPETYQHFTLKFDTKVLANRKRYYDTGDADMLVTATYVYFGGRERGSKKDLPTPKGVDFNKIRDFSGCIINPTLATALREVITSVGFERQCLPRPVRYLTLLAPDSYLITDPCPLARAFTLSISFRTRQKNLIFLHQAHQSMDFFSLGMIEGRVVLKADTGGSSIELRTELDNYDDGAWYHVSVVKEFRAGIFLHVGYESKKAQFDAIRQSLQTGRNPLYVGGLPKNYEARHQNAFFAGMKANPTGTTLRDLVCNGGLRSFINYQKEIKVNFDDEDFPLPRARDLIIPKPPTRPPIGDPTEMPTTTMEPTTTEMITTMEPTTMEPTAMEPTTMEPTTMEPTTMEPTTMEPTTMEPSTMELTTMEPTTMEPTTMRPSIMVTTPTASTGCTSGPSINRDNATMSFSDDPNSYAKYEQIRKDPVMKKVVGSRTRISLEFRALGGDGIIFYSANGNQADFLVCFLLAGKVKCRFSAGSGIGDLVSTKTYNDRQWHTLLFTRKLKQGTLKINNVKVATTATTGGSTNVDGLSDFYLGGVPKGFDTKRIQERQAAVSFPGCIRSLMVSSKAPGAPDDQPGVVGCLTNDLESGSFFDGGFITLVEVFHVGVNKVVMLEIKPRVDTAIIFSTINKGGDYLVLALLKGDLVLLVENGNGPLEVRYSPSNKRELCDGQWHRIRITKKGLTASLKVDGNDLIEGTDKGPFNSAGVKDPLYLGGVPDDIKSHKALKTTARYKGCIRGFLLDDGNKVPLSNPFEKSGEVYLHGCPVALP